MNEIYWLTRLDNICGIFATLIVISIIIVSIAGIAFVLTCSKENEDIHSIILKVLKVFLPVLIISSVIEVFTPNSKEAMMIWGIGGTIDYVKSNDTAKQIPDKCIKALDKFVDKYMIEDENK